MQPLFNKVREKATYRYDSSLAPELNWDGRSRVRELGEWLLRQVEEAAALPPPHRFSKVRTFGEHSVGGLADAVVLLKRVSRPFLDWAGKAERLSFDVPTLPLFIHERLSTKAIVETLREHKKDRQEDFFDSLFGSSGLDAADQVTQAYEYPDKWVNRLILGDSLVVMNSLLRYESLGGQVQCIYIDPPYGVKFGSNFQPFIRKRDVAHNDDDDFTREPEMVQAYRDTWELGLHSYLTYLRDRLLLARDLLTPSGSIFVQISDENLHHVREVMDEVFGGENYVGQIAFRKTGGQSVSLLPSTYDFLLMYARDISRVKYRRLFTDKDPGEDGAKQYIWVESPDGTSYRKMTAAEMSGGESVPTGWRVFRPGPLTSPGVSPNARSAITLQGRTFAPGNNRHWSLGADDTEELDRRGRVVILGNTPCSRLYLADFPVSPLKNVWPDTGGSGFAEKPLYVVQTDALAIQRCLLMTTDPGDLVFDPTCGSGTTAVVAEQWGRRWITCDTSRVPLALARQRLLTATFPYYELKESGRGPAGGFVYKRRQNQKGEEVGGIVPHITLKSIANDEPPKEEVLVDRPEVLGSVTRVSGPFTVEATIPTAANPEEAAPTPTSDDLRGYRERMLEVLRRAPVLRLAGNRTVTLRNVRAPAKTLNLSAEALVDKPTLGNLADDVSRQPALERDAEPVAILFGPESGAMGERMVREAWDEAQLKRYAHLYVIGFAIDPKAREFIGKCEKLGMPATYLAATPDLQMGDLLKNMRSSQIFSVCGLPDVQVRPAKAEKGKRREGLWEVEVVGLDTFDPVTMKPSHLKGDDLPAWFLDTNYNGLCFHVCQAFFPRTSAWESLKKALRGDFEASVWDHLSGTVSAPFQPGDEKQVAVKVIDDRGNELMVVRKVG